MGDNDSVIPPFVILSLNIKGLLTQKTCENKLIWLKQTCHNIKNLGVVHLQETNFNNLTDARRALMRLGGKIIGLSTSGNSSKGVVSWVPKSSPIFNLITDVKRSGRGRWALMKIEAAHQIIHLLNILWIVFNGGILKPKHNNYKNKNLTLYIDDG